MWLTLIASALFLVWLASVIMGKGGFVHLILLNALGVASVEVMTQIRSRSRVDQTISADRASDT